MRSEELADAYDEYAPGIYSYCRSMLRQPADAADAVHATFLIAAEKSDQLRDKTKLKAWLYAVARNECIRIHRSREIPIEHLPEVSEIGSMTSASDREYQCALVRDAALGVNQAEREVLYLQLQGMEPGEQAATLGIGRRHLASLSSRAKDQLEDGISVLLVARNGRQDCTQFDKLLIGWDGQLTPGLRRRLARHIRKCAVCGTCKRREMSPDLLGAVIPMAFAVPLALRDHVLDAATSTASHAVALRAMVTRRAGSFGRDGFPRRLSPTAYRVLRSKTLTASAAGTLISGAIVTGLALGGGSGTTHLPLVYPAQPTAPTSAKPSVEKKHRAPGTPSPRRTASNPGHAPHRSIGHTTAHQGGTAPGSPSPAPEAAPAMTTTTKAPSPGPTQPPKPTVPATSTAPAPGPTPAPTPAPTRGSPLGGTLIVSPTILVLAPLIGSAFTITASGGTVSWSMSEGSGLLGKVTVSASSGTLQAGQSATVSVWPVTVLSVASTLTVEPGNIKITVVAGTGLL